MESLKLLIEDGMPTYVPIELFLSVVQISVPVAPLHDLSIYEDNEDLRCDSDDDSIKLFVEGMEAPHPNDLVDGPLTALWPQEVKCEMNIPEWHNALAAAGLLPQFDNVLDGFANGFHQGIPEHMIGVLCTRGEFMALACQCHCMCSYLNPCPMIVHVWFHRT
jgi:hypothetical protein